jgi:hypothetical protein
MIILQHKIHVETASLLTKNLDIWHNHYFQEPHVTYL